MPRRRSRSTSPNWSPDRPLSAPPLGHAPTSQHRSAGTGAFSPGSLTPRANPASRRSPWWDAGTSERGPAGPRWGIGGEKGCKVGESGLLWGTHAGPGWQGSSHPATRVHLSARRMRNLDLPRHLRTRARREAPAHRSGEVPRGPRRRGRAGLPARAGRGQRPLALGVAFRRVRRFCLGGARGHASACTARPVPAQRAVRATPSTWSWIPPTAW